MNSNKEALLDELTDFVSQKPAEIPSVLDEYLCHIAKTGDTLFPWHKLKPLLCRKLELVMNEFHKVSPTDDLPALPNVEVFKYEEMKEKVLEAVNCFNSAPFTIQRLCELVVDPRKHYKRTDKFMRGLEKNVLVVSTIEPKSLAALQQANAAAMPMVNGIPGVEDGGINGHFADTTEDSLNRMDGENGHCEDEGICADDPGTNVEVPSSVADDASLGEAPQPVTEEVVEEQEVEPSGSTEQTNAESSEGDKEEDVEPSAPVEQAEAEKGAEPQPTEEIAVEAPIESIESEPSTSDEEPVTHTKEPVKEAPSGESPCDKNATEEVAEASSESGAEDVSGTREEPASDALAKEPSVSAEDHSEADALPVDASEPKPAETLAVVKEGSSEVDCCDSSISEMPESEEELKEPPLKKFHPEPETHTEEQGTEEQEQPSSTSVSLDDSVEEEAMESSKADSSPTEDGQAEAMDTTAESSAQKDSPIEEEEEKVASPDESAMEQD
ncbi:uncharacterized protein PPP4R2r isoform X1 [Dermacentor andersoni]|uniref:uncharacterized protein PPP4R2r isoform X1 n=1 Tax=Dermacentor andersoni TaxID=34620 RepID=UPI002155831C|nr:serine/threonine-protein phosphatase 4 regulatory subunit 2-like isoform X1 [Dermacentor andersoni]